MVPSSHTALRLQDASWDKQEGFGQLLTPNPSHPATPARGPGQNPLPVTPGLTDFPYCGSDAQSQLFVTLWTEAFQAPRPWGSPGKNTGVGSHSLL